MGITLGQGHMLGANIRGKCWGLMSGASVGSKLWGQLSGAKVKEDKAPNLQSQSTKNVSCIQYVLFTNIYTLTERNLSPSWGALFL